LVALSVIIAAFPRRLPNHCAVAWFFLLAFAVGRAMDGDARESFSLAYLQAATALTYFIAAFHKLNSAYFDPATSCGSGLLWEYLLRKKVAGRVAPRIVNGVGIHGIVMVEFALPVLLAWSPTRVYAIGLAIAIHAAFGFAAHAQFSVIMLGGLAAYVPDWTPSTISAPMALSGLAGGTILAAVASVHRYFRLPRLALLNSLVLAILVVLAVGLLMRGAETPRWLVTDGASGAPLAMSALLLGYLANGAAPYLGLKFDFSLAMFSNLRPDRWNHWLAPRPRHTLMPRYARVIGTTTLDGSTDAAGASLSSVFPRAERECYSMGYIVAAVRDVSSKEGREGSGEVEYVEISSGRPVAAGELRFASLRRRERVSVYPYTLPLRDDEPLCM